MCRLQQGLLGLRQLISVFVVLVAAAAATVAILYVCVCISVFSACLN